MVKIDKIVIENSPTVFTDIYTKNEQYGIKSNQEGRESQSVKRESVTTATKCSIFIVHGRDNSNLREVVARLLEKNGFEAIILNQKQNEGLTIIEKFEKHASTAAYAIVLLTPDDLGGLYLSNTLDMAPRARQNVFFEMGYFYAKLGREKVCTLYQEIEMPSDLQGVLYIPVDRGDEWKGRLMEEIKAKLSV